MLKLRKSTNLNGEVLIDGNVAVVLSANISDETAGSTNVNTTTVDSDLYALNKKLCRDEIAEFKDIVYEIEDEFIDAKIVEEQLEN